MTPAKGLALMSLLSMAACATDPFQAYPEAQSVRECEVLAKADENARERALRYQGSSGNWLADAIAGGVGAGVIEAEIGRNLEGCVARVSGAVPANQPGAPDQPNTPVATAPRTLTSQRSPQPSNASFECEPGKGAFQKGTLICPGF